MTPEEREVLNAYVRALADTMGLRDWTFEIAYETDGEDTAAHVTTQYGRRVATVSFRSDFRTLEPEFQRQAVVHELIHVPLHGVFWYIIKTLPDLLGSAAYAAWEAAYHQLDEVATDTLAVAIAPFFPLIEWSRPPRWRS